jgi:hypothetical protein
VAINRQRRTMPRDTYNALMITSIVFYLLFNIIAPVCTLTPFTLGIAISEIAIISLYAWRLPYSVTARIAYGVFVQYAATCCFLIGCKFYFEQFGSFLAIEIALVAHSISLVGFLLFFLFNAIMFGKNKTANLEVRGNTNDDAAVHKHQFSVNTMFFWFTAVALLFVLFKASWPVENGDFSWRLRQLVGVIAPLILLAPLTIAGVLYQHRKSRWVARIVLLFALPAVPWLWLCLLRFLQVKPFSFQSYDLRLAFDGIPKTKVAVLNNLHPMLMLYIGFLISLVAVCVLLRAANVTHDKES